MQKKLVSPLVVSAVLLALVGCTPGATEAQGSADCTPTAAGASSDKVEATGDFGTAPTVTFADPLTASSTERTVLIDGEGETAVDGSSLTVNLAGYNATSGEEIAELAAQDTEVEVSDQIVPGLLAAIQCSKEGDRIAAVIPPADFAIQARESLGLATGDAVVLVVDVTAITAPVDVLPKADGADQPLPEGFPAVGVELAEDGAPTITIPADTAAPTELQLATLKMGDGTEVAEGDVVVGHYTGVIWDTGDVFDSSWERGEPTDFQTGGGVVPGFDKALIGATVGSQVLAIIPPAEGYGDMPREGSGIKGTDTLVFVVDILAIK